MTVAALAVLHALVGADDPLYAHGVNWVVLLIDVIKTVVVFAVLLVSVMLMIWFERKVISDMQSRIGPNRAGPFGIAQTLADGIKLFFKEDLQPDHADTFVFKLAPYLAILPAFLAFAIVPVGGVVTIAGHTFELQLADPPQGILWLLAMSSIAVYGVMLAGWSSGSKYPLLGAVRASAQMISYEAALGMTVVTVVLVTGSLSTRAIVDAQAGHFWQWNAIRLVFVPFLLFFVAIVAETNRPPFDLVEAESELVGGFHTEYSSIRFALFFLAEFMNTITMSAITVTLFFGGPDGPIPHIPHTEWLWPILWFLGKTIAFLFVFVWLRAALPRLRYDQLMDLGWKRLIPAALAWLLLVAGFLIDGWWGVGLGAAVVVCAVLLTRAFTVGAAREEGRAILPPVGIRPGWPATPRLVVVDRPGTTTPMTDQGALETGASGSPEPALSGSATAAPHAPSGSTDPDAGGGS
jgi:NADH-quinone oxidoreductase subunit H